MSSTTSRESNPFNKAIIQWWTNQKKIYENEIKKLKEEVKRYQEMLDNTCSPRSKSLSLNIE
jgi:hypothetical protein